MRRSHHHHLLLTLLAAGLLASVTSTASAEQTAVQVPGTRVCVAPPNGFESAQQFPGFQSPDMTSSIMISELPAPFDDIRRGMTKAGLATRGMTLLSSERVPLAGVDGVLLSVSQDARGVPYLKWLGAFGDARATVMVVATFPKALETEMSGALKQDVLSVAWNPGTAVDVFDGLSFRIEETANLKIANRLSNMLMLTRDGRQAPVAVNEPLLIVGSSISEVQIDDVEAFARNRITQTASVREISGFEGAPVTVGDSPGYELTAAAADVKSGLPVVLYRAIVVKENVYYIVQGLVGAPGAAKYVPEFRKVLRTMSFAR
jgi:hypothetical protein